MNPELTGESFGSIEGRTFISRAVIRQIESGNDADCAKCDDPIKFQTRKKPKQVIANVYEDGVWQETKFYHAECYEAEGQPYGRPFSGMPIMTLENHEQLDALLSRKG